MSTELITNPSHIGTYEFNYLNSKSNPDLGFSLHALAHTDSRLAGEEDGCYEWIEAGGRTPIIRIADPKAIFTDRLLSGHGTLVVFNPNLGLSVREINADNDEVCPVLYPLEGSFFTWVANMETPLEILGTNRPIYYEEQEEELELHSPKVPVMFRDAMLRLIRSGV